MFDLCSKRVTPHGDMGHGDSQSQMGKDSLASKKLEFILSLTSDICIHVPNVHAVLHK